jgi:hypothetical protein
VIGDCATCDALDVQNGLYDSDAPRWLLQYTCDVLDNLVSVIALSIMTLITAIFVMTSTLLDIK